MVSYIEDEAGPSTHQSGLPTRPVNWWKKCYANEGYSWRASCKACMQPMTHGSTYTDGYWHHASAVLDKDHLPVLPTGKESVEWWNEHGLYMTKDNKHKKWGKMSSR